MRTVSINVYNYEDIEKDTNLRKKVIENNSEINNTEDWYLDILPKCVKYIESFGFTNVELNFKGLVNCDTIDFKANFDISNINKNQSRLESWMEKKLEGTFTEFDHGDGGRLYSQEVFMEHLNRLHNIGFIDTSLKTIKFNNISLQDSLNLNFLLKTLKESIYNIVKEYYNYLISDEQILNTIKEKNYEVNSYGFIVDFD